MSASSLTPKRRMSLSFLIFLFVVGLISILLMAGFVQTRRLQAEIDIAHPMTGKLIGLTDAPLHVVSLGDQTAPPQRTVVLIHGATSTLDVVLRPLAPLFPADWRVIAMDRPGHGWSPRAPHATGAVGLVTDPSEQARRIVAALTALGVPSAHVFGHSLGGMTALTLAQDHPKVARSLTLLSPVSHPWPGGIAWHYTLTTIPVLGRLFSDTIALPAAKSIIESGVESAFKPQPLPAGYVDSRRMLLALRPSSFRANAEDVAALLGHVEKRFKRWSELALPVRMIAGDVDTIVSTTIHSQALVRTIKGAALTVIPNGGHNLQESQAALIVKTITVQ